MIIDNKNNKPTKKRKKYPEVTLRAFVKIDGVYHNWDDIPPEQQKIIGREFNDRMFRAAGYVPVTEIEHTNETA